jgi:hypothetical protein
VDKHTEGLSKYKKIGVPILSQSELGVPSAFASKIPVDFKRARIQDGQLAVDENETSGTLLDLLEDTKFFQGEARKAGKVGNTALGADIKKYIDEELVTYIESIRFPLLESLP